MNLKAPHMALFLFLGLFGSAGVLAIALLFIAVLRWAGG